MKIHAQSRPSSTSALRRRAAVLAAGVGVSVAMGSGAALAAQPSQSAPTQAGAQKVAAAGLNQAKAQKKQPSGWVTPVSKYTLGPKFGRGGALWSNKHSGQDFSAPSGIPVRAAHGGIVVEAGWGGAYGNNVVIKHGNRSYTQYAHISKITDFSSSG
ncbi:M23 family metallopeptidase [Streptomyces rochei]|uniref:M23 family metallopeptidase n=1 Tax=Streptomyces TaxID=1883 RepID=UPI0019ABA26B|nr:hypothetical protein GCM10018771_61050 [Streptomyces cellulosae]